MPEILIMQLAKMGDFLQTLPLIQGLKESYPDCKISVLVDQRLELMTKLFPEVDEVIPLNLEILFQQIGRSATALGGAFQLLERETLPLKGRRFRLVFSLNYSMLGAIITSLIDGEKVIGYQLSGDRKGLKKGEWLSFIFHLVQRRRINRIHLVDVFRYLNPRPVASRHPLPTDQGGKQDRPCIGMQMGSRHPLRQWPAKYFAQLTQRLREEVDAQFILLGTENERKLSQEFFRILPEGHGIAMADLTGKTTIPELISVLKNCALIISGDTGTMHLAAHLGIPVLGLFIGPAWCHETGPYGANHWVIQTAPPCAPCVESRGLCPNGSCGELISPDLVSQITRAMLGNSNAIPPGSSSVRIYRSRIDHWGQKYLPDGNEETIPCRTREEDVQAILYREMGRKIAQPAYDMDPGEVWKEIHGAHHIDERWLQEVANSIHREVASLLYRRQRRILPLPPSYGGEPGAFLGFFEEWMMQEDPQKSDPVPMIQEPAIRLAHFIEGGSGTIGAIHP